jgi:MoaA/NifB/PqqE/SkfB family radical SAM enzyme
MSPANPARRRSMLASWRAIAYGPALAQIVITRRCNIDCGYCNEYDKTSRPVPKELIQRYMDKLAELALLSCELTGGETLLHPEVVELVAYMTKVGFPHRWIITNGYLLSAETIDRLNDAGLTHLQISVDGVTPTATTVKVLKPLRKKLETLATRARFVVQVNAVLGATNAGEAAEVARTARELGFRPRVSVIHDGQGAMALDGDGVQALRSIHAAVGRRFNESGDYRRRLIETGEADFRCRSGSRYLYIDEFGLVNWCSQQRGVFTKPILEYTWDDLREQFHTKKGCSPTCTIGCARSASRFDEWRAQDLVTDAPHRAPARNQEALIPATALVARGAPPIKRSQATWRRERAG